MKNLLYVLSFSILVFACSSGQNEVNNEHAIEDEEAGLEFFGELISLEGALDASSLLGLEEAEEMAEVKVKGVITDVCQMKGCWMKVDLGNGETMRVTFKDYGFFVPKDAAGREVIIEGLPDISITDVETLRHYAEDAGKSEEEIQAITTSKKELKFEAKGVIIK
jgi:hypothetical protein